MIDKSSSKKYVIGTNVIFVCKLCQDIKKNNNSHIFNDWIDPNVTLLKLSFFFHEIISPCQSLNFQVHSVNPRQYQSSLIKSLNSSH